MTTPFSNELCGYSGNYGGSAYTGGILIYMFGSLLSDLLSPNLPLNLYAALFFSGWRAQETREEVND